jgi:hypothetical protein
LTPLSSREAAIRFAGVLAVLLVGYLHLLDISHKIEEGVWYMATLFTILILTSIVLAVGLAKSDGSRGRFVWVGAAAIAGGALFGFCVSRLIPLPGMADHQGDWTGTIGVFAVLTEAGLVALAGFALRDRVVQRQRQQVRSRRRSVHRTLAAPAGAAFGLLLAPALSLAHNGEEMTDEEMAAMDDEHAGMDMSGMEGMSHDPLLGTGELFVAFLALGGLAVWCGYTLRGRAAMATAVTSARSRLASYERPRRAPRRAYREHAAFVSPRHAPEMPREHTTSDSWPAAESWDPLTETATQELLAPSETRARRLQGRPPVPDPASGLA